MGIVAPVFAQPTPTYSLNHTSTMSASHNSAKTAAAPAKKTKSPATKKSKAGSAKTAPAHPAFADMAIAAIQELKEKKGSSLAAIKKFVADEYKLEMTSTSNNYLRKAVRKLETVGRIVPAAASGKKGSGCYKMAPADKVVKQVAVASVKKQVKKVPSKMLKKAPVANAVGKAKKVEKNVSVEMSAATKKAPAAKAKTAAKKVKGVKKAATKKT